MASSAHRLRSQPQGKHGVYCSAKRTLTIVARDPATSASYTRALSTLTTQVHETTGIQLTIEPRIVQGPLGPQI
jgi:hypothetical protein